MRRPTAITLIVLLIVIVVTAIAQLSVDEPSAPFAGPTSPGQLSSPTTSISP